MYQLELPGQHAVEVGYVGTRGRNLETFTGMNNVTRLLPPGTNPQPHVHWPDFARGSTRRAHGRRKPYDSMQLKFQRRYHKGLQFLVSYTLSEATTNAGDSLSGGGVGGLRAPDVAGWDLENDIGLVRFPHQARAGLQRQLRSALQGRDLRRLARQLGAVRLQRPGPDDRLHAGDRLGHGLLRARRRRSVRRQPRRRAVLQPGGVRQPGPVATIGQTDFSPLGGPRSQVTGPPMRQLDMGIARQFRTLGASSAEFRVEVFNLTNTPAFNLPGSLNFGDARNFASITQHAQHAAADAARLEVLLVAETSTGPAPPDRIRMAPEPRESIRPTLCGCALVLAVLGRGRCAAQTSTPRAGAGAG